MHVLGTSIFGRFEVETPWWRLTLKWGIVILITYLVYRWIGHWAMLVVVVLALAGTIVHFTWCRKNGIDPWRATPRRKYYELRGWAWLE
ncbi:MAG: hypothetical protein ACE5NC_11130 [Anaerolineae bacterium]